MGRTGWLLVLALGAAAQERGAAAERRSCRQVLARCYDACIARPRGREGMQECLVACGLHFKVCEQHAARAGADAGVSPDAGAPGLTPSRHPAPPPEPPGRDLSAWDPEAAEHPSR